MRCCESASGPDAKWPLVHHQLQSVQLLGRGNFLKRRFTRRRSQVVGVSARRLGDWLSLLGFSTASRSTLQICHPFARGGLAE